jgi:hypothetical protein
MKYGAREAKNHVSVYEKVRKIVGDFLIKILLVLADTVSDGRILKQNPRVN